jgi:membrane protein DedA with SNARE-associated domain
VTEWITRLIADMGYVGIALLMFLENLFPPIPSEVIMPMAGFTAADGELSIVGVLIAGTLGTLAGALFWYYVARTVSEERLRGWLERHGRWLTIAPGDVDGVQRRFRRNQRWAIPVGHLIPGLRTLISIPAGLFAVGLVRFVILTSAGGGVWTSALGLAGFVLGRRFRAVEDYVGPVSLAIMAGLVVYYIYRVATYRSAARSA